MSDPTTYRRVPGAINGYRGRRLTRILEAEQLLLDEGALVPVVPCKHIEEGFPNGHIDPHYVTGPVDHADTGKVCLGAGNGDNDNE